MSAPQAVVGTVARSTGSQYRVLGDDGTTYNAGLRGIFRQEEFNTTNPVAVGDRVTLDLTDVTPVITNIHPRHNHLLRASAHRKVDVQIIAANLDQAAFVFTIDQPFTKLSYLDAFLVMCEAYHIPARILFNKTDLIRKEKHRLKLDDYRATYEAIGYPTVEIQATDPAYLPTLREIFEGKTTFLAGPSGAGKSSVANALAPDLELRTQGLTKRRSKGRHTTTFAELHPLPGGGAVVDAPGFSQFEVANMSQAELGGYYPEIRAFAEGCAFRNCLHLEEPNCAVVAAVEAGEVALSRYNTYVNTLEHLPTDLHTQHL